MTGGPAGRGRRVCAVGGCGRRHYGRSYCRTHHARWVRHGDPHAELPIETAAAGVSYWTVHQQLRTTRGPASGCPCTDCGRPAAAWSYLGGAPDERVDRRGLAYSADLDRYRPRCRSCHRRATTAARPPRAGGAVPDPQRVIRLYRAGASGPGIAALLGVSRTAIYTALRANGQPLRPRGTRAQPITDSTVSSNSEITTTITTPISPTPSPSTSTTSPNTQQRPRTQPPR